MSQTSWTQIEDGLKSRRTPPSRNNAESFKQDFKARASLMRQDSPDETGLQWPSILNWRYIGAVTAVVLAVGVMIWPSRPDLVTQVKSLQVMAPHSGVIIMTDENNQGTIVWVTDMESGDGNKG